MVKTTFDVNFLGIPCVLNVPSAICLFLASFITGVFFGNNILLIASMIGVGYAWNYTWPVLTPKDKP